MKPLGHQHEAMIRAILMARDTPPTDEHAVLTIAASKGCTYFEALGELDELIRHGYLETLSDGIDLISGGKVYPTCLVMLKAGPRFRR